MQRTTVREKVHFASGDDECAAWLYPTTNGACVIMAGGMAVTKEPGTDAFATRFAAAGFGVLAFDYRRLGESGGTPRQVVRIKDQLADWDAAIAYAATRPGVDPARMAAWGFSFSGGYVIEIAADHAHLAAAIAQTPNADGRAATRNAVRFQRPAALLRLGGRCGLDTVAGWFGRAPRLVPLSGPPGTVALLTTPDGRLGDQALNPGNRYPDWVQAVAARSVPGVGSYRPGRLAGAVSCPLLVVAATDDQSALAAPAVAAAERAPRGEVVCLPGGHYAPFLDSHEQAVVAELDFLNRHLVGERTA